MRRSFNFTTLILVAFLLTAAIVSAQTGSNTWAANPDAQTNHIDANRNFPVEPFAMSYANYTTTATTTTQAITALAGRKKVTFYGNTAGTAGTVWISVGTTTAAISSGIPFVVSASYTVPLGKLELDFDANVPLGYISSTAVGITVVQSRRDQ